MKFSPFLFILAMIILWLAFWMHPSSPEAPTTINSFDECARAGYPIMESYPRQCRTPEGKLFVEEVVSGVCRYSQECGPNFYCKHGVCTELEYQHECTQDEECMLIDNTLGLSCCYAGACAIIDYSEEKWIAVNKEWFEQQHQQYCPSEEECGPAPLCPIQSKNENFRAKCTTPIYCIRAPCPQGLCEKVSL